MVPPHGLEMLRFRREMLRPDREGPQKPLQKGSVHLAFRIKNRGFWSQRNDQLHFGRRITNCPCGWWTGLDFTSLQESWECQLWKTNRHSLLRSGLDFRGSGKEVREEGERLPLVFQQPWLLLCWSLFLGQDAYLSHFFFPVLILMVLNGKKKILLGGQMNSLMLHSNPLSESACFQFVYRLTL